MSIFSCVFFGLGSLIFLLGLAFALSPLKPAPEVARWVEEEGSPAQKARFKVALSPGFHQFGNKVFRIVWTCYGAAAVARYLGLP